IRVIVARVHEPAGIRSLDIALESGGEMNRRRHRAGRRIDPMTSMNREGFQANFTPIFHNERQSRRHGPRLPAFQEPSAREREGVAFWILEGGALRCRKIDKGSWELAPPKELWLAAPIRPADSI